MYRRKGVVYKLQEGWFIDRTPGGVYEFKVKAFSVEIPLKEGKV